MSRFNGVRKESSIEKAFLRELKKLGLRSRKMNGNGFRAWPDRMILIPGGSPVFIEFKRPGEKPTELQLENHKMLTELNYPVYWTDSSQEAIDQITKWLKIAKLRK